MVKNPSKLPLFRAGVCCCFHNPHLLHGYWGRERIAAIGGKHIKGIFKYLEVIFEGEYQGRVGGIFFYFIDIVFCFFRNFFSLHFHPPPNFQIFSGDGGFIFFRKGCAEHRKTFPISIQKNF